MSPMDGRDELRGRFTRWIVITAEHAQKNYLRAEKKQLQTVPLEEADVAIADTALLSAGVTPDSFDFEEQRLAEAFRELPLMRRRILEMLFVEELTPSEIAAKLHCSVLAEQAIKAAIADYYTRQGIDPTPFVGEIKDDHCDSCCGI